MAKAKHLCSTCLPFCFVWCMAAILFCVAVRVRGQVDPDDEAAAREWLAQYNEEAMTRIPVKVEADWAYNTNITDYNNQRAVMKQ